MSFPAKTALLILTASAIAGCEDAPQPFSFATTYDSFDAIEAQFATQVATFAQANGDLQDTNNIALPADFVGSTTGSVLYNGGFVVPQTDDGTMIGQLQLDVSFATDTISGVAGNLIYDIDGAYVGTMFGNTGFDRTAIDAASHFNLTLAGTLSNGGNSYDASLVLSGNFLNEGLDTLSVIAGDADLNLGGSGQTFDGGAFAVLP